MTTQAPLPPKRHLPALTGLRFFLALWVIFSHLIGKGNIYEPLILVLSGPLQELARKGYQAVPTFFVLSGFVLARTYGSTLWNPPNFRQYLTGRFARVYPVYLLSLLIVLPFIVSAQDLHKGWLVAMHLTLLQGWFTGHYRAGWNTPAWSLSCEMFFYLVFPLLVVRIKNRGWAFTTGMALVACLMTQVMWFIGISDQIKPIVHLSDFLLGIAVARAFDLLSHRRFAPSGTWFYAIGFLGSALILMFGKNLPHPISANTLLRPMNGLLLLGLGLGHGWLARLLSTRPIVYLGKASYAMYILHIPILWWAVSWPTFAVKYLYVPFVVALSCVVYQFFEEPANRLIRFTVIKRPVPTAATATQRQPSITPAIPAA